MDEAKRPFVLGWQEWIALPDLGLPAIKAKIDTGARTSALHAFLVEAFGPPDQPMVRFGIHPIPGRLDIEIYCAAPVVDRREVTSSNGEREVRYVIASTIEAGGRRWPVEITLTNREGMSYRMLIGRQAIRGDVVVDPSASFHQPKLSYKLYRHLPTRDIVRRPLRIAVVTGQPRKPSNRRLEAAGAARGHVVEFIDTARLGSAFDGRPQVTHAGTVLAHYDAVIARVAMRDGGLGTAAVRELELMGAVAPVPADALERLASPMTAMQILAHRGIAIAPPAPRDGEEPLGWGRRRLRPVRRVLIVGRDVVAVGDIRRGEMRDAGKRGLSTDRALARRAVQALGLRFATVDVVTNAAGDGRAVARVSTAVDIGAFERVTGARVAELVIADIERQARSWVRRPDEMETDDATD
jgi:hypothetical protein